MILSPSEAEESLAAIQTIAQKTRRSIASGGTYITLIVTGTVWLIGFLATQFLSGGIVISIWIGASLLGSLFATVFGLRMGRRVRSPATGTMARRVGLFWLLLVCYGMAAIAITRPTDGRQVTMFVVLFFMIGQFAMGLLFSFSSVWWTLPITALALLGYFLLPGIFFLWMAVLGGGGMIALGLYIHSRW